MKQVYFRSFLLVFFFLLQASVTVFAQSETEKNEFRDKVWSENNTAFQQEQVPDKWKSESVVNLANKVVYELDKQGFWSLMDEQVTIRRRLKILDNDGVKAFSELEFEVPNHGFRGTSGAKFFFGAKVIKPGGKELMLKEEDLVQLEIKDGNSKAEKYKIAVPELEPEDIIDYYFGFVIPHLINRGFESASYDFLLSGKYHALHQEYNIILNKNCHLNADSYNGAPAFELINRERNQLHYQLTDIDREKYKTERWTLDTEQLPFLKFKAYYYRKDKHVPSSSFPNMHAKINRTIGKGELLHYVRKLTHTTPMGWRIASRFFLYTETYETTEVALTEGYLRRNKYKKEKDPLKTAEAAYYYLRHMNFGKAYEYKLVLNKDDGYRIKDKYFVKTFSRVLEKNKIDHEIIFCVPATEGINIKNALHSNDVRMLVAVRGEGNQKVYFDAFTHYTNPGEIDAWLEGVPAYAVRMVKKKKERRINEFEMPGSLPELNRELKIAKVTVALEGEPSLHIEREVVLSGHRKTDVQYQLASGYNYVDQSSNKRNLEHVDITHGYTYPLTGKERRELPQKMRDVREENDRDRKESHLETLKSDASTEYVELEELELIHAGIWSENPELVYTEKFLLKDYIQRAGSHYLLELGKLIGSQISLEKDELERNSPVRIAYARTLENKIEIQLPDGYLADGLEKFNFQVENKSGAFISKAEQQGNKIIIHSTKIYKQSRVEKEDWQEMVDFLAAAYDFSQQKLLVKKAVFGSQKK